MSDEPETTNIIPQASFGWSELEGIERILWSYIRYMQKSSKTVSNKKRIQILQRIHTKLKAQLQPGSQDVQLLLNLEEIETLLEAMLAFATLIKRVFPKNGERDAVIESVIAWRSRLIHIMNEF